MNKNGGYIHMIPQRKKQTPGYQMGVLASQLPALNWSAIATAQLQSGKRADIQTQTTFDNSFRGLPYKRRQVVKEDFEKIKEHCEKSKQVPTLENVQAVFMTADTQQNKSVVGVFALDVNDNIHLLQTAQLQYLSLSDEDRTVINQTLDTPVITVEDMLQKEYLKRNGVGIKPLFCVMDRQGHRSKQIQSFAQKHSKVLMYQGCRLQTTNYKPSANPRLMLVSARHYQAVLIYYLYSQKKRGQNYFYFPPDISDEVLKQIICVKPDSSKKNGNIPQNWEAENGAVHDFFDVLKMAYFAVQFMIDQLARYKYRFGQSPAIRKRWQPSEFKMKQSQMPEIRKNTNNWFSH